ncbi:SSU ribosomal protein S8E [Staphylothermus marinus F1]|uniref:Small ribosomal subunit protein eS8 n=1 Tax=Staphylothermus marinus (strain ATCC 43588 / DSM 3639 / JCM 9404 / F1) TaxID=399550 RepID=RS8E_STAMF|nr:30S ribosomal protein S8e [Staphylothermus marinus]A3DNX9.1 RecName: Full=Small ribosomal subunit protein eS8; AltName: Full=30S ribosomal protein S8e [Staphylothermus marinus F1]ABN70339.1 SSU ribosomal protein S8E [Staphylothermus marinus F1]
MAWYQGNDLRKPTGGKKTRHRKKRKHELGRPPTMTRFSVKEAQKIIRVRGGNLKIRLKRAVYVNVAVPNEGKVTKTRILEVVETPSNPQYARGNYITKGTIVRTELGLVKITSRPGQDGVLNGILLEK